MAGLEIIFGAGEGIIISTIHAGNKFIEDNHVLVTFVTAVGGTVAAYKSFLNTRHLQKQAELQRQIETNNFNLSLFSARLDAYDEFVEMRKGILQSDRPEYKRHILENFIKSSRKLLTFFRDREDDALNTLHLQEIEIFNEFIEYDTKCAEKNHVESRYHALESALHLSAEITADERRKQMQQASDDLVDLKNATSALQDALEAKFNAYRRIYDDACSYIDSRLVVPQNAFEDVPIPSFLNRLIFWKREKDRLSSSSSKTVS